MPICFPWRVSEGGAERPFSAVSSVLSSCGVRGSSCHPNELWPSFSLSPVVQLGLCGAAVLGGGHQVARVPNRVPGRGSRPCPHARPLVKVARAMALAVAVADPTVSSFFSFVDSKSSGIGRHSTGTKAREEGPAALSSQVLLLSPSHSQTLWCSLGDPGATVWGPRTRALEAVTCTVFLQPRVTCPQGNKGAPDLSLREQSPRPQVK